jgi:redox-regulated HSP33 family molecular chaperone
MFFVGVGDCNECEILLFPQRFSFRLSLRLRSKGNLFAPNMSASLAVSNLLQYKSRDVSIKTISRCGNFRLSVANTRNTAEQLMQRHHVSVSSSSATRDKTLRYAAEVVNLSTLMASFLQREERVVARCTMGGECRGLVAPLSDDGVAQHGTIRVDRALYHQARPVTSVTTLSVNELTEQIEALRLAHSPSAAQITSASAAAEHLISYFTPHANTFFSKSEGVTGAVLLRSDVSRDAVRAAEMRDDGVPLNGGLIYNTGLVIQPIVADQTVTKMQRLQQAFFACLLDPSVSEAAKLWDDIMLRRALEHRSNVQDMMSLATGDFEGAFAVAERCRLPTTSTESCAAQIEPLRKFLALDDESGVIALDPESSERTPIDFFCRCSKEDFVRAMASCSVDQLQAAKGQSVLCKYCRKDISPTEGEWETMIWEKRT